jgi:DNA-binding NtrC family response regulator
LIAGRSEPIQVLLTDMSLPLMQGPALAAQVRARHAGLLVLFMSGSDDRAHLALGEELIEKPFQLDELLEHLARLAKLGRP